MNVIERKFGRIFSLNFEAEEDFYGSLVRFVKEKNIRAGAVFFLGAFYELDIIPGVLLPSPPMPPPDETRLHIDQWVDVQGQGYISWPDTAPGTLLEKDQWTDEPEPYVHLHLTVSGGPRKPGEVYAGHLCDGRLKGMIMEIYELL
ncbi:PCC domain-containing protein [Nitrospinota bacterium]